MLEPGPRTPPASAAALPGTSDPAQTDVIADLVARARITDLIADYAQVIDWLDWDRLDSLFWPEAQFDFGMFKGDFGAYRDFVKALEEGYSRRLHMFTLPSIRISGEEARIDVGCVIVCRTAEPAPGSDATFWGRYLLGAQQRGGEWRLSELTYVLNLGGVNPRDGDDTGGPMNLGDGLSVAHPYAKKLSLP
ncbi:nuclear transport factor 2 family protein [Novosphingobium sp. YJ-S2-02]|uniref:Nuclear transport factor 2 family protein n=1 Tax=Novosphingobium aureum TaxID=2792964 RepID=A0A931HEZ8_9SPHN|nr:nuclear transport factor 2 family protein [Novosphingobium aureum]MBH0114927.1 nuclear transport factor 2 family protein [Novosphingobium aureum]